MKQILIVGGGFGGVAAALALAKRRRPAPADPPDLKIRLVSDKPHFEYTPALYRVVTGRSPLEVCVPIAEIVADKEIEFLVETIEQVDLKNRVGQGRSGSRYPFDYLVLALGSETAYYDIPGLPEFSFGFKSIREALRLKEHFHKVFEDCAKPQAGPVDRVCLLHFVVVGGGASGVELAGELTLYCEKLAKRHQVDRSLITVDLIEAAQRILPTFPPAVAERVARRLRELGVNIFTNRAMLQEECEEIILRGMRMKTETVIWTAGVKPNSLYEKIQGLAFDQKGRVLVDDFLQAQGFPNVFVVGDGAATPYSGLAQTAILEGKLTAENILRSLANQPLKKYHPQKPYYSLPVGPGWAATLLGSITIYGSLGWLLRRLADLCYFLSILPLPKAVLAFRSNKTLCETCEICLPRQTG